MGSYRRGSGRKMTEDEALGCAALVLWGFFTLVGLGALGVLIWALIKLVLHVTA